MLQEPGQAIDVAGANQHGQQLFFANMLFKRRGTRGHEREPHQANKAPRSKASEQAWKRRDKNRLPYPSGTQLEDEQALAQLALFDMAPDPEVVRARARQEDSDTTRYCIAIAQQHADRYGWSVRQRNAVFSSLRLLQTLRDTPNAKVRASDVMRLRRYDGTISSTIDVLSEAGLLIEDVPTRTERYFATKTDALPPLMRQHLELWLQIMLGGSRYRPRQFPREPETVRNYLAAIAPLAQAWAEAGYQSFAEVTHADVVAALPEKATDRYFVELGLKSLFKILKGRKLVFANPTRGLKFTPVPRNIPLALDPALVRAELNSPNPATALAVALSAFHALTKKQLRELQLTDIVDGRLLIGNRNIPLAAPVRTRLTAWLDHRHRTWPGSANPHLLINRRTAPRLVPAGPNYPWLGATLRARALREDRILHEIHATGGDVRRICDLFGLTVSGATRYLATIEHPDLAIEGERVP
ncbi:MAG: hypothetical protein L0H93_05500 [Nocardioides sp.]|nr:hypothetical protein [Nocardioides sp.]